MKNYRFTSEKKRKIVSVLSQPGGYKKCEKKIFSMELCTTLEIKCFMPIIFKGVLSIVKATILHVSLHIHGIVNYNFF